MKYVIIEDDEGLRCSCGARAGHANERKRFLRRHPKICSERTSFAKELASGTRSVEGSVAEDDELEDMVSSIESDGRGLTVWEKLFMESLGSAITLSEKQREVVRRIYAERVVRR